MKNNSDSIVLNSKNKRGQIFSKTRYLDDGQKRKNKKESKSQMIDNLSKKRL